MNGEDNADASPVFQSRLRAKKEERMLQRQQEQDLSHSSGSHNLDTTTKAAMRGGPESSSPVKYVGASFRVNSHRPISEQFGEDSTKRRERAESRKRVIEYHGSVWDAVSNNDLEMVRNYILVEGAQKLLRRRHPDAEQGGRTLLHCAAWYGYRDIVELILTTGYEVDVVDSVASKTTALIEAARAGNADVCATLLRHGASPRHRDSYGDTAFHWAGRQGHGTVLLQMALEQERLETGSTPALWVTKNYKGRTVVDLVQSNAFVVPLLKKRLGGSFTRALESAKGKRRSRFPVRAAVLGTRKSILIRANSRPGEALNGSGSQGAEPLESAPTTLSGVEVLGLDVSTFTYRSRGASTASLSCPPSILMQRLRRCGSFAPTDHIDITFKNSKKTIKVMEGFILTESSDDHHRHHLQKKKKIQEWRNLFVKLDDISARLTRSQTDHTIRGVLERAARRSRYLDASARRAQLRHQR